MLLLQLIQSDLQQQKRGINTINSILYPSDILCLKEVWDKNLIQK
jgi:hypothetical protein